MTRAQIILIVVAVVFILAGATIFYMSPSKKDLDQKVVARSRMAKKNLWKFRGV